MLELGQPWWELVVRAGVVYCALLLMVRVSGKRTIGQSTPFDLLVVMLLSESVSPSLSGGDDSLTGGLILAATLIGLNLAVAYATARNVWVEGVIQGRPILIGRRGSFQGRTAGQPFVDGRLRAGAARSRLRAEGHALRLPGTRRQA